MDSLTQLALGAAVGESLMGRKVGRKALLWGAIAGTLPDLDVFIPLGDAVKDFTYHRSASHSLFILAALTPLLVWLINRIHPRSREYRNDWMIMIFLVFATHVLLDSFTAYGTQIFWPFVTTPMTWSTIFIIDPLYTLPLLIGIIAALVMSRQHIRGHTINNWGLAISCAYLMWTLVAKVIVDTNVEHALKEQNIEYRKVFTTPSPFNSLLWRVIVRADGNYYEGYYSVLDSDTNIRFIAYADNEDLLQGLQDQWPVQRLKWFSKGFYGVSLLDQDIVMNDLRMGVERNYVFRFKVGEKGTTDAKPVIPERLLVERDLSFLNLIWQRIWNEKIILQYPPESEQT
jgi:inner membrane protein